MVKRIITAVIGFPILIMVINIGGWPLKCLLLALGLVGLHEFYSAITQKKIAVHYIGYLFTALYYVFIDALHVSTFMFIFFTALILAVHACLVILYKRVTLMDCFVTLYGFFYVPFLLSFIYLVRVNEFGPYFVWLIFTSSFGCDTFAYFTGITLGRHKLKDTPSPSKSVEGIVGGIIGAALVGLVYGLIVTYALKSDTPHMIINATLVSLAGAVFSIFGDLSASAVKRYTGIKDFGNLLPGHGGVLDRFDSVIVTAPIVYMVMKSLMWLIALP